MRAWELTQRAIAVMLLLVLSPVLALVAAVVLLGSGWPVLHTGRRMGRDGRPFAIHKFRTMHVKAAGPVIAGPGDARVTRVGRHLRATRLDELPQLWDVVRGRMLLVGPRPEDPGLVDLGDPAWQVILSVHPGITGPTQLTFADEAPLLTGGDPVERYRREVLPQKLASDLRYVRSRSVRGDLRIVASTVMFALGTHPASSGHLSQEERDRPDVLIVGDLASIHVVRFARGLRERGIRVEVAGFEGTVEPGIPVHRLGRRPAEDDARYLLAIPVLVRVIRERRPLIVHGHYVSSFGLLASLACRLAHPTGRGFALVQTAWGTDLLVTARRSRIRRWLAALALRPADLITADSVDLEEVARRLAPRVPFHRFVFGPPERLLGITVRRQPVIISSRRLDPDMRIPLVIRAFRRALGRGLGPDWRLVIAGTGSEAEAVRAEVVGDVSIEVRGLLEVEDLARLLASARVIVSTPVSDATSAALLEGLASGLVPVVNDLPANREWVDADVGEITPRDPEVDQLASAMVRAAARADDPAAITRARARVSASTWEAELHRLIEVYRTIAPVGFVEHEG